MTKKTNLIIGATTLLLAVGLLLVILNKKPEPEPTAVEEPVSTVTPTPTSTQSVIGTSVDKRNIEAYTFGTGETDILFVGGVHGGYEWNSILLAYETIDHFQQNENLVPDNITVHIIPNLNPDGLFLATGLEGRFSTTHILNNDMHTSGRGRFNSNNVDLNRNFACKWAPNSRWRGNTVSAGTAAFSEPEAQALQTYVTDIHPKAAIFWHSKANNVYASECESGVLPETLTLMRTYSDVTSYGAVPVFDAYPITGDAEGWLASIGIPAITVELGSRTDTEWEQNLAGTKAVLDLYSK